MRRHRNDCCCFRLLLRTAERQVVPLGRRLIERETAPRQVSAWKRPKKWAEAPEQTAALQQARNTQAVEFVRCCQVGLRCGLSVVPRPLNSEQRRRLLHVAVFRRKPSPWGPALNSVRAFGGIDLQMVDQRTYLRKSADRSRVMTARAVDRESAGLSLLMWNTGRWVRYNETDAAELLTRELVADRRAAAAGSVRGRLAERASREPARGSTESAVAEVL